ncbi:MAG: cobalt-precorrin-5B (C(1))-methyltransferase [Rhodospirillales bacterium]|jgi:cobalt-precorrin-5B (C1)-methyltransferase|nr:cobalt-precorrin-5B (C(1))-methyltransferase [Rhodospirillales bacterium]MDP6883274.1 cobalt-precorrin-5B (C(1))-methyltransferase [Rhodospirillales bacterium]
MARKPSGELRRGWTTGACATAATRAAYTALVTGTFPDPVTITLPRGEQPSFALARENLDGNEAMAAIVKDAGDDPDVTHCALIVATVRTIGRGVTFKAGAGVGTVTKPGLPLAVGEPAINPVPRRMMTETVAEIAAAHGRDGDVEIEISVPGGEDLARHTMNGRLGILGGLSILGTTGIVVPYSCSSWIASIRQGIDVARAEGITHAIAATGSVSEAAAQKIYDAPESALIDMGDFVGGLLKYLRDNPIPRLTIAGGFAKIAKLAAGNMDLHSGRSQIDFDRLAEILSDLGADPGLIEAARHANTASEVLGKARAANLTLAERIANDARVSALDVLAGGIEVEVLVFDRDGVLVGRAHG